MEEEETPKQNGWKESEKAFHSQAQFSWTLKITQYLFNKGETIEIYEKVNKPRKTRTFEPINF